MKVLESIYVNKKLQHELSYFNEDKPPCQEHPTIIFHKKKLKKRNKSQAYKCSQQPSIAFRLSTSCIPKKGIPARSHTSMPVLKKNITSVQTGTRSFVGIHEKNSKPFLSKFTINLLSEQHYNEHVTSFYPSQTKWKVYRCQLGVPEESCCCSCNSDAMFEVMKSLYDCYKKKNCDDCDCILCGHIHREERRLGELRKSMGIILEGTPSAKQQKEKIKAAEKLLQGKTPAEKERILRDLVKSKQPLPKGKTASEKSLIKKIRTELGLPPAPKTAADKEKMRKAQAAGLVTPLEGKTAEQKEKIIKAQAAMGIELPEGRTPSEKALINKIKTASGIPIGVTPEMLNKARAAGLVTPLEGKTPAQKEKILRGLAMEGIPLPEGQTTSEKKLVDKVRADLGLPPEPKNKAMRDKYTNAANAGLLQPLEGKSPKEKERILKGLADLGIPLPEGRTASEKSLIAKVQASAGPPLDVVAPSEKMRRAKAGGLITPLEGKTPEQKEKILRGLAIQGIPLPEGKTPSDRKLIDKVRADLGLPPEPKTQALKDKHMQAANVGLLQPLEGKTPAQKEKILQGLHEMGIPLPEGRTPSEKSLIAKIRAKPPAVSAAVTPSEKVRKAKAAGLLTPLTGKSPAEKEKILKGLAMSGIPLPEGKTTSEKKLIDKVRADLGLPSEPKTPEMRKKYEKAANAGLMQPLEGKSPKEKERILKGLQNMGIPLPEGRTSSEKSLIAKIKAGPVLEKLAPSEKMRRAKAAGLITPLAGKTPEQKEKILKGLAMHGIPLPEGKSPSEKKLINKVRADLGLPPDPTTPEIRAKHAKAADAGLLQPLEGKTRKQKEDILQGLHDMGIPLPEGRTASEKSLIAKVKAKPRAGTVSERKREAKAAGVLTPLTGKSPAEKEKILKGLAMKGLPLPEGKTPSEKKLIDKVRGDLGLPPEPKNQSIRDKHTKAADAGLLQPLEGKSPKEKERILKGLQNMGIPLPEGRTSSEKSLIAKIKAEPVLEKLAPSEKMRRAKAAGLITPLAGKTPEQKEKILKGLAMHGIPLPEGKSPSEKKLINKVRADLGLPPDPTTPEIRAKHAKAADAGLLQPLEGKTRKQKEDILQGLHDMGIPLPEGRTASEKSLIAKVKAKPRAGTVSERKRDAKAAGVLTPLTGKSPAEKEKILKGLAMKGLPLPEGKTPSEKKLIDKVRADLGLPPEPKNQSIRDKHTKAADAGLLQPLEGKSPKEKERILKGLQNMGIPLPEGRTSSEKSLIAKIKAEPVLEKLAPSEKMRRAKAAGLITPLAGKTPEQKEKILKGLAMHGIPLPEGKSPSEKKLINKVRADLGLPPDPTTPEIRAKHAKAADAGLLQPLEGKTRKQKEDILQGLHDMGIPLPEGRTASEKSLIAKVKAKPRAGTVSERKRQAKAAGVLTPLTGKSPAEKEKILKGLAMKGLPLPEGKTPSEKKLIDKVRADLGLPPEPKNQSIRDKHTKAADAGLLQPLEGKSPKEKERILKGLQNMGIPLPEGRTPSEKALIGQIKTQGRPVTAGLLTPLEGKTPAQKEKILKGAAMQGLPLPEGKTPSEKKLIDKIRNELGLPPEPTSASIRDKHAKAAEAGLLQPLEGKSPKEKERILKGLANMGIPLPEGRTPSEKALIAKVKSKPAASITTDKIRKAKAAGLLTPLAGKPPEQREKILKGLAKAGLPLPEGKTPSEKALISQVKKEFGIPDRTPSEKLRKAKAAGLLTPLEGKTPAQREKILRGRAAAGLPLPPGKSPSERALIQKIKDDTGHVTPPPSERLRRAKAAGLLTPIKGKSPSVKEKILRDMLAAGVPIPEGETPSEKDLIKKVTGEHPVTPSQKRAEAERAGLLTPLQGKTPEQKRKILKGLIKAGVPLPEPKTASDRDILEKVRAEEGLPPEPKTPSLREKYRKAQAAGIITPLEGKSPADKENILKRLHDTGIPLPEGRTPSEKEMVKRIKASPRRTPSERLKAAKAAGLLTPLEGKTPAQKEKILKGLAKAGVPLPEGKSASEKDLIKKVRKELGLPPEPKTPSIREKMREAHAAGIITPLEGKSAPQKEKILKALAEAGIPLPEGRTASEKALVDKVKAETTPKRLPSSKLRKAKAAGLITPLKGKPPKEKERILKGLAKLGLPLPEAKTASEKKIADKVRAELGLPPEPKTPSMKERHEKASAAGVLVPLEGLSPAEKEKVLKAQADLGLPLPEGRTPSEKALVAKVKEESKKAREPTSAKLRKAKSAGLLTPLKGKSAAQKEKIMRGLADLGLPLPEAKTPSEKALTQKVRAELGLPPEPKTPSMKERHEKASAAGVLVPLEGLSPAEKEKVLKAQADLGLPLPEGRTPSEKALIAKVKAESEELGKTPSGKLQKARAAGLLEPMEGKSPAQKEKILRGLAKLGIPLPEAKTASEKKLAEKIRAELGLPPEPKTPSMKERHEKAADAGVLVPLEGLSPDEKEKVLRAQADYGVPLPEGRTPSEKALIAKIKAEQEPEKVSSEKLKKAKAAGLITPLEGKSAAEKEKIIRGLAEAGLPLPEGKTPSEKSLIHKIRTELGIPPPAKTPSEKAVVRKAKAEGLFTPLSGKTEAQKEKILKGLAEAGLPMPVGKTASEKALIKKIRTEAGLPPLPTPSEKLGKIKTKSKKVGVLPTKKLAKGIAGEEYQDIKKTTKCDRACGCDKKKIRFKHSYVKIRVTSPDISSFCDCPDECIPGVKAGAFIDNEGIKVTVGRAVGTSSYSGENQSITPRNIKNAASDDWTKNRNNFSKDKTIKTLFDKINKFDKSPRIQREDLVLEQNLRDDTANYILNTTSSDQSRDSVLTLEYSVSCNVTDSEKSYLYSEGWAGEPNTIFETLRRLKSSGILYPETVSNDYNIMESSSGSSFESVMLIKSETSLSLTTNSSESLDTLSVMSFPESSVTSNSSHSFGYQLYDDLFSHSLIEEERSINRIDYDTNGTVTSISNHLLHKSAPFTSRASKITRKTLEARKQHEYLVFRMSQTQFNNVHKNQCKNKHRSKTTEPIVVINHLNKNRDVKAMVDELLARNDFSDASSIFVVVPSDDNDENSSDGRNSTICIQMSENPTKWKNSISANQAKSRPKHSSVSHGVKISAKGKKFLLQELPTAVLSSHNKETMVNSKNQSDEKEETTKKENTKDKAIDNVKDRTTDAKENMTDNFKESTKDKDEAKHKLCQATIPNQAVQILENSCQVVSTDTTADRPCCCSPEAQHTYSANDRYLTANVMSKQIIPLLVKQGMNYDSFRLSAIDLDKPTSFLSMEMSQCPEPQSCLPLYTNRYQPIENTFQDSAIPQAMDLLLLQKCQCSPEKLRELLEQAVKAGRNTNLKSVGVGEVMKHPYTNTPQEKTINCAACLQSPSPTALVKDDTCVCTAKAKPIVKSVCPCTAHDPPDSEAEPDLKSDEMDPSCSPCPTGPCGEAPSIIRSSTNLEKKEEKIYPKANTEIEELGYKIDKDPCFSPPSPKEVIVQQEPQPQESQPCPDTCLNNPRHLMQRLRLRNYGGRKSHKEHTRQTSAGQPPAAQPHPGHTYVGQPQAGQSCPGQCHAGQGQAGQGYAGQGQAGQGYAGQGYAGQGQAGQGYAGQGYAGQGQAGQGHAGQGYAGQGLAGQGQAGQGYAGQGYAGQGQAGQGYAGQGYAGQGYAGQGHAGQGYAGQGHAGQGYAGQGYARQGYTGQGQSGQGQAGQAYAGQGYAGQGHAGQGYAMKAGGQAGRQTAPPGAMAQIETGEAYKQVLNKQARFNNSTVGTTTESKYICDCPAVTGKKKKKILCECPVREPPPEQQIISANNEFNWIDDAEINKLKSTLTETTSGFKMNKRKRPPAEPEKEFSIDDAIRYYASIKPELFRDIVEEQQKQRRLLGLEEDDKKSKRKKSEVDCSCVSPVMSVTTPNFVPSGPAEAEHSQSEHAHLDIHQEDEGPFRGLKFRMGGKGSGSPGLTGICCFDMVQESFTTW